jgi:PAS domain S-box-containing protein
MQQDRVNILLVDDQPAKLLSYEVILRELGENLIKASSAQEALQHLLKNDVAVVLVDVCMPELDGFELAAMIRQHPRFQRTAIIFISAILLTENYHLRGYEMGAVDYVPVPVVPEVLRAKVRIFSELYRTTRQLEKLNKELETRVAERTAELEASNARLLDSEQRRSVALMAGQMGSWDWDLATGECAWDAGQYHIFGVERESFEPVFDNIRPFIHLDDLGRIERLIAENKDEDSTFQTEVRIVRPSGEIRWCICAAALTRDPSGRVRRVSGVSIDITDRKQAEERQLLLAREVDHRARNTLAVVQAIVRLTRAPTPQAHTAAIEGRIRALAQAHTLLSQSRWAGADVARLVDEELGPYRDHGTVSLKIEGPPTLLAADKAQILALALHELATNSAKYGALSSRTGELRVSWETDSGDLVLRWDEAGGPQVEAPSVLGFGTRIINTSIKHQIGGDVSFDWRADGLQCTLSIPYAAEHPDRSSAGQKESNLAQLPTSSKKRIFLVEDEALIGIMMRDLLTEFGLSVIGPVHSVKEGMSVIATQNFDCAILDLNLRGEQVYPLAQALAEKSIPFVFATGYDSEAVDHAYSAVRVLQKPIARDDLEDALRETLGSFGPSPGASAEDIERLRSA